jgi:hypothetical protein
MFTLDPDEIAQFDLARARRFVECWSRFYSDRITASGTKDRIDYFAELNLGRDLTEENVRRLLRWKDPQHLTHPVVSGPNARQDNPAVVRVLRNLAAINAFRNDRLAEADMRRTAEQIFPQGPVWRVFLLHIAKPHSYPIADKHVLRAFSLHTQQKVKQNWNWGTYLAYRNNYFGQIAQALSVAQKIENIRELKRIDDALLAFGRFVGLYYTRLVPSSQG